MNNPIIESAPSRKAFLLIGGGVMLLVACLVVPIFASKLASSSGEATEQSVDPTAECATTVHFYADDVVGANYFGPPLQGETPRERLNDKQARRCQDPALVVADGIDRAQHGVPGYEEFAGLDTDDKTVAKINELVSSPVHWREIVQKMNDEENAGTLSQEVESGEYKTLYMISRPGSVPLIRATSPDKEYTVLSIVLPTGQTIKYQVECGGQPRNQDYPVPPLETPPSPPAPPIAPPPRVPPTTTPSPTTVTTAPPTTVTTCASGKCEPATTVAPPPTTAAPPATTPTTLPASDSGPGATNTIPPSEVPTTMAPPAPPPPTIAPPIIRVEV